MKPNQALGRLRTVYPFNAEERVETKHTRIVAPSKRFSINEFLLRATNFDAVNDEKTNNSGRLEEGRSSD